MCATGLCQIGLVCLSVCLDHKNQRSLNGIVVEKIDVVMYSKDIWK